MSRKPKMGRPRLPKRDRKGSTLSLRLTREERAIVDDAAERAGVSASEWIRGVLADRLGKIVDPESA